MVLRNRAGWAHSCRVNTLRLLMPPVLSQHQRFLAFSFLPYYACVFSNTKKFSNIDTFAHSFQSYNSLEWKVSAFGWILEFWIGKYFTSEICKHRTFFFFLLLVLVFWSFTIMCLDESFSFFVLPLSGLFQLGYQCWPVLWLFFFCVFLF